MKTTVIFAMVEPLSFTLDHSLAWNLTTELRAGNRFNVVDAKSNTLGQLIGLIPILQPIRAKLELEPSFIILMRAVLESPDRLQLSPNGAYHLASAAGAPVGGLVPAPSSDNAPLSALVLSQSLTTRSTPALDPLRSYISDLTAQLWNAEPINWTTHALQLASTGQYLASDEITMAGIKTGVLRAVAGSVTVESGTAPLSVAYRKWRGAGTVRTGMVTQHVAGGGSASATCTFGGGSSTGGDFGSGSASLGGGGESAGGGGASVGGTFGGDLGGGGGTGGSGGVLKD